MVAGVDSGTLTGAGSGATAGAVDGGGDPAGGRGSPGITAVMLDGSTTEQRGLRARRFVFVGSCLVFAMIAAMPLTEAPMSVPVRPLDEPGIVARVAPDELEVAAPASLEQLRGRIAAVLEREGIAGVGLALVRSDGIEWAGGVGLAERASGRPVDADTQFRVASITKSIVALGVARLAEQDRLDLGRPLAEWMPEIEMTNAWAGSSPISLAHALEHTAGFDEMRYNEYYADEGITPREALVINPRSRVARWRPGSRMSYANPGYTLAGHAIERVTGESWETYLEREVLRPLGMRSARFRRTPEFADRLATGYRDSERVAEYLAIAHAPAGSLLASPRELAGLVQFWLTRGEGAGIVGPATLARIERTETLDHRGTDVSYGLGNYGDVFHPVRSRGHDGGIDGFLSCYRYFPELGVGYVMLLNGTHSLRAYVEIRALLFAYLTRGRVLPEPPTAAPDHEAIAAAAGFYRFENPRVELVGFIERAIGGIDVRAEAEGVTLARITSGEVAMVPTGDGGFRHPRQSGTSVRLTTDGEDRRILDAGMAYFEAGSYWFARGRLIALQGALGLIQFAPWWALGWALQAGVRRLGGHRPEKGEAALHLWPAVAGLLFMAMPVLLLALFERGKFSTANGMSVALCACTLAFAASSAAALAEAVRAGSSRTLRLRVRLVPSAAAVACFAMTLYLLAHGIIGLRIWAW